MNILRRMAAGCALLALGCAIPAQARCWAAPERDAVSVRELQTMLMVASLRCRAMGIDILADYNGFMRASRGAIEAANSGIKAHFANGDGQEGYDRFVTMLANHYGDDATDADACADAAATAHEAAAAPGQLLLLATSRVSPRALPDGVCAGPASRDGAVTIAAATPPVVQLPDEVVAALAVIARYDRNPVQPAPPTAPRQLAGIAR